jgi:hypothetical protein
LWLYSISTTGELLVVKTQGTKKKMILTDDELLKKTYQERADDALAMALAERLETLLEGLDALMHKTNTLNP